MSTIQDADQTANAREAVTPGEPSARVLARFVHQLTWDAIPRATQEQVKRELLDILGVCLAASSLPFSERFVASVPQSDATTSCDVIGKNVRVSAADAALLNGVLAHGIDYDDTHAEAIVHVSASLAPTALAMAQRYGASGAELLTALVAGYEVSTRVGLAASGEFHKRGYHPTSICGAFGAAMVAGKSLKLSESELVSALGIVGSQASGIQQFLKEGSEVKRLHAGWAAHSGIYAASMAQHGVTGPERIFEGGFGLYATHLGPGAADMARLTAGLGETWETDAISIKPYPCCHLVHAYMDTALTIKREQHLTEADIVSVECPVPQAIYHLVCTPDAVKRRPQTSYDALFSLPFCVGVMLARERAGLAEFDEAAIGDEATLTLAQRITTPIDDTWSDFPRHFSGWVIIHTTDGRRFEAQQRFNRGSPENPLTAEDIMAKFTANATRRISAQEAGALADTIAQLDRARDLEPLFTLLRATRDFSEPPGSVAVAQ